MKWLKRWLTRKIEAMRIFRRLRAMEASISSLSACAYCGVVRRRRDMTVATGKTIALPCCGTCKRPLVMRIKAAEAAQEDAARSSRREQQ